MKNLSLTVKIPLKWDIRQSGVYCIRNRINGKIYIGSSLCCYKRVLTHHYGRLRNGCHTNPHLQSAWNKYGEQAFEYFIVELCEPETPILMQLEQKYIDSTECLKNEIGYNINPFADRNVLTPEQRAKISKAKKGQPRDPVTKAKMLAALERWKASASKEVRAEVEARRKHNARKALMYKHSYRRAKMDKNDGFVDFS